MADTLNSLIQSQQSNKSNKTKLGYSVSTYDKVLEALQQSKYKNVTATTNKVMGKDMSYADVEGLTFDANGFSTDTNYAIWKMSMSRWGAMPVKNNETQKILIAKYDKDTEQQRDKNECPVQLRDQRHINVAQNFLVGAKVDLTGLGLAYFNDMFCSRGTSHKMEASDLYSLVSKGILNAQVIFPNVNGAGLVGIIGQTKVSDNAVLYINNCILGCSEWKQFGVDVQGTNSKGKQSLISGGTYQFALDGASYSYTNNTIQNFGRKKYNQWVGRKELTEQPVTIVQNVIDTVYVRFFITPTPENIRVAENHLPQNYSHNIYKTFGDVIRETNMARPQQGGSAQVMLATSLEFWKHMVYNEKNNPNGITYDIGGGHGDWRFQGDKGDVQFSMQGLLSASFSPLFVPINNPHILDCSSFSCMMLFNSGIFDKTKIPTVLDSTGLQFAEQKWGDKILPQYKITNDNYNGTGKLYPGDVLYITNIQRGKKYGHAAVVYKYDEQTGDIYTLEINTSDGQNLPILKKNYHRADFYKHLLRFVDNV